MDNVRKMIADTGAILEGNFFFALKKQGNVSCKYINMDPVFTDPDLVNYLGDLLAEPWIDTARVIAAPAVGAIPLLYSTAGSFPRAVKTVWADKQKNGTFAFERMGFAKTIQGRDVLILEDIVSTGGSAYAVVELVRQAGGKVIGASFIWNRGNVTAKELGVPELHSIINESVDVFKAGEHPQWGTWPLVGDIGHPEYFPDYPGPKIKLL